MGTGSACHRPGSLASRFPADTTELLRGKEIQPISYSGVPEPDSFAFRSELSAVPWRDDILQAAEGVAMFERRGDGSVFSGILATTILTAPPSTNALNSTSASRPVAPSKTKPPERP